MSNKVSKVTLTHKCGHEMVTEFVMPVSQKEARREQMFASRKLCWRCEEASNASRGELAGII